MGCYILNAGEHPPKGKADTLIGSYSATQIAKATQWPPPPGKIYVVVIPNLHWEAAFVVVDYYEFCRVNSAESAAAWPFVWLEMPIEKCKELNPSLSKCINLKPPTERITHECTTRRSHQHFAKQTHLSGIPKGG